MLLVLLLSYYTGSTVFPGCILFRFGIIASNAMIFSDALYCFAICSDDNVRKHHLESDSAKTVDVLRCCVMVVVNRKNYYVFVYLFSTCIGSLTSWSGLEGLSHFPNLVNSFNRNLIPVRKYCYIKL